MAGYTRDVKRLLADSGCYFDRQGKGDHEVWFCPAVSRHVTVDGNIKSRFTANAILQSAGLRKSL